MIISKTLRSLHNKAAQSYGSSILPSSIDIQLWYDCIQCLVHLKMDERSMPSIGYSYHKLHIG